MFYLNNAATTGTDESHIQHHMKTKHALFILEPH